MRTKGTSVLDRSPALSARMFHSLKLAQARAESNQISTQLPVASSQLPAPGSGKGPDSHPAIGFRLRIAFYSDVQRGKAYSAEKNCHSSARLWRQESAILATSEMQIPRFARDDNLQKCQYIVRPFPVRPLPGMGTGHWVRLLGIRSCRLTRYVRARTPARTGLPCRQV